MSKEKSPNELAFDRKFKVAKVLENAVPSLREGMMRNFDRMNFGTNEDFDEYLTEVSDLVGHKESKSKESGISQNVQDWIKEKDPSTSLGGKDLNSAFQVSGPTSAAGSLSGKSI